MYKTCVKTYYVIFSTILKNRSKHTTQDEQSPLLQLVVSSLEEEASSNRWSKFQNLY